jgi:hypothetical protein
MAMLEKSLNRGQRSRNKTKRERKVEFMRKLFLAALAISGLALIPAQRSDAQNEMTVLVPRTEGLSFGFPAGYHAYPSRLNYYPYGYHRHPYVHYYPYAGNRYSYYSAPQTYKHRAYRTHHRHHRQHNN